tara:strand:- start:2783 stop:3184 length:402 start_codon:yes stop_codon:yes gene_type:complete
MNAFFRGLNTALGLVCIFSLVFALGPEIDSRFFPVLTEFDARVIDRGVDAVIVTGTVIKKRNCEYIPYWTARTFSGRSLRVEIPDTDLPNWATGNIEFAPLIVYGVGQDQFEMFAQHRCHPFWTITTHLGVVK